jgi:hypothetical protein
MPTDGTLSDIVIFVKVEIFNLGPTGRSEFFILSTCRVKYFQAN